MPTIAAAEIAAIRLPELNSLCHMADGWIVGAVFKL